MSIPNDDFGHERYLYAFWRGVDVGSGETAHEFYTPEGVFFFGEWVFTGQDEIRRFYKWRRSGPVRTTRHLVLNPQAEVEADCVTVDYSLVIFGGPGVPPLEAAPPNMIADASASFVQDGDRWLMRLHRLTPVMSGAGGLQIPDTLPD